MSVIENSIEIKRDAGWCAGVVIERTKDRLVVAVGGDRSHRVYMARMSANWRHIPKEERYIKGAGRKQAIRDAHNVFARGK